MNFLNIFEDHVAGIFGATRAPFSFKKLAKQAARDMEDQTLVINGVNTAPALFTILIAADDDPMLAPFYPELSREVREFVKAQAEKRRYVFVGEPLVRFMIDPQLRAGKFSVFAENVDAPTLGRLYEEERAYQNGLGQNNSAASRAASAPRAGQQQFAAPQPQRPAQKAEVALDVVEPPVVGTVRARVAVLIESVESPAGTQLFEDAARMAAPAESEVHVSARRVYGEQVYGLLQKDRCMILRHIRC